MIADTSTPLSTGLKPYSEYKDSGLPWLGQVPEHWATQRLRHACEMRVSNVDKHTKQGETPVSLCNYVEVYKNERICESTRFMAASASEDERIRFGLRKGDVVITKDSEQWNDIGVPSLVEFEALDLVCGYHLAILRSRPGLHGSFLHRALECNLIAAQFHVEANGVTRYGLSQGAIKGVAIPVPPLDEQAAIVRFLDHATHRLDKTIQAKRKTIALLNEQKQAIIHRAVTRGLDPNVPLKDSGIPWVGQIPAHWDVRRAKYLFREVDSRSISGEETHLSMSQKLGLVPSSMVKHRTLISASYAGGKLCDVDDLVLNRLKAHLGVFARARDSGVISPDYTVLRKIRPMAVEYFEHVLRSPSCRGELKIRAKGLVEGFWRLYTDDFYDIRLPVPPYEEQASIVNGLHGATNEITTTMQRIEREIELLREYRTRLIADVVTGKLDVREAAASLPEEEAPAVEPELAEMEETGDELVEENI